MSEPIQKETKQKAQDWLSKTWNFLHDLTDLRDGLDKEGTIISIKSNKSMNGANAWLLMCSIFIASLGLDLNSPAVIIGAMLISPLMAPILGIGLGIGINDRNTLNISANHLLIAIVIALFSSTLYFSFSSLLGISNGFTNEIAGRTGPSVLDAMVALIGGFAGIISSSRKDKSNAIPGVAIATALMPPLCVTGYGVAHWLFGLPLKPNEESLNFFSITWNSFFLFFLNATLVALATYLIVRFMKFPSRTFDTLKEERRSKFVLYFTSFVLLGISFFTTYNIIIENRTRDKINKFVDTHFGSVKLDECLITKNIQSNTYNATVSVMRTLDDQDSIKYNQLLKEAPFNVMNATLRFIDLPKIDEKKLIEEARKEGIESNKAQMALDIKRNQQIDSLETVINSLRSFNKKEFESKIKEFTLTSVPELESVEYYPTDNPKEKPTALAIKWNAKISRNEKLRKVKEDSLRSSFMRLMEIDSVVITHVIN